jgi:hypothetical protein
MTAGRERRPAECCTRRGTRLSPLNPLARLAHGALGMSALPEAKLDQACAHFGRAAPASSRMAVVRRVGMVET